MNDEHYFQIWPAGADRPIFRERVYCYELYHQLRTAMGDAYPCKLDGELDKSSYRVIGEELVNKKPDFVVHVPHTMRRNLCVVEVKPVRGRNLVEHMENIGKDLDTLELFLEAGYHRGLMLIYGDGEHQLNPEIVDAVNDRRNRRLWLIWHSGPSSVPERVH